MKGKLVEISWLDADGEAGWSKYNPKEKLVLVKTFGILVDKTDQVVVHADSFCHESGMWSGLGRIPRGMVKKIRIIATVDL